MKGLISVLAESALVGRKCPRCDERGGLHMRWCSWPDYSQDLHVDDRQSDVEAASQGPMPDTPSALTGGAHWEEC